MDELTRDDSNASCTQEVAQLASLAVRFVYASVDFILLSHSLSRRFQGGFLVISIKSGKILASDTPLAWWSFMGSCTTVALFFLLI